MPSELNALGEGQPAVRRIGLAQQADQRVGHDLYDHHAAGQYEQRQQEQAVHSISAGGDKQQAACHHQQQPGYRPAHVADPFHQFRARNPDQEIGGEKGELDQHGLREIEREQLFQLGDNDIVEGGDAAENEEQREHECLQAGGVDAFSFHLFRMGIGRSRLRNGCLHCCCSPLSRRGV